MDDNTTREVRSFLTGVQNVLDVRDGEYGNPVMSFSRIAELWEAYLDYPIQPHDVANMMILMKVSRNKLGKYKEDTWNDIAGYATLGNLVDKTRFREDNTSREVPCEAPMTAEGLTSQLKEFAKAQKEQGKLNPVHPSHRVKGIVEDWENIREQCS